jgi:hypothetical protein
MKESRTFGRNLLQAFLNIWESPISAAFFASIFYLGVSAYSQKLSGPSPVDYFNYLADAFLHGQFNLRLQPPASLDLSVYQGKTFLNWEPFPAILLMPWVLLFGVNLNDVLYTALLAGISIGLFAFLLQKAVKQEFLHLSKNQRALLVIFLCLGTVLVTMASKGKVWQTAQIIAFCFTLLVYLAVFTFEGKLAWFLTGLLLTCATLSRATTLFVGIFPFSLLVLKEKNLGVKKILFHSLIALFPLVLGFAFFCYYNWVRFGNILETGMSYHQMADVFVSDYQKFGASNIHYFWRNLYYEYLFYPLPMRDESTMGGSLFLLSPLFFAIFPAIYKGKPRWGVWALLISVFLTNLPIMFHMSTGWVTFGPRYTLDFTVPLLLLTAIGMEEWDNWISIILALLSIGQYLIGNYFFLSIF